MKSVPAFPNKILIFGCGNMGGAMLQGWIAGGVDPSVFTVVDPAGSNVAQGVNTFRSSSELHEKFAFVILGIKPQMLEELAPRIAPLLATDAVLVSILAGKRHANLAKHFPSAQIVRLMPNLAAAIGKSPLGLWSAHLVPATRILIEAALAPLGATIWLSNEDQMDAVTALAGSGPAFVYRFIDALTQGGVAMGLAPDVSATLALAMTEGATLLAAQADEPPAKLADRVTSPGGTTAAGLSVLDHDGALLSLIETTLRAAAERGAALSNTKMGI
jgi:pyrroline-5-carboxylate reductase